MDTGGHAEEVDNVSADARMEKVEKALGVLKRRHGDVSKALQKQIAIGFREIEARLSRKQSSQQHTQAGPQKYAKKCI